MKINPKRGKALEPFTVFEGHYLLVVNGTGQITPSKVSCSHYYTKTHKSTETEFYHLCQVAVLVNPCIKGIAFLVVVGPITRRDRKTEKLENWKTGKLENWKTERQMDR